MKSLGNFRKQHLVSFITLVTSLFLGGCHSSPQHRLDRVQMASGVTMRDVRFFSHALNREMPYRVFLPVTPVPGRKLSVVYLLHGGGSDFRDWSIHSDVSRYAHELILVMPEGDSSYYTNASLKPNDNYEDYLLHDLVADVESRFPAATGRKDRAIIGISMGGFAAVKLALTHPESFEFVGAISPAIDVPSRKFNLRRPLQSWRFRSIFGPDGSRSRKLSDPYVLVQTAEPAKTPYLYITSGEQEPLLEPIRRFVSRLRERNFAYEFHSEPGGHGWDEWRLQVPGVFAALHRFVPAMK